MSQTQRGEAQALSAREGRRLVWDVLDMDKPLIAKVRGPAIGGTPNAGTSSKAAGYSIDERHNALTAPAAGA